MCASLAGLDLAVDPKKMTRDELVQAIEDPCTESAFLPFLVDKSIISLNWCMIDDV